MGSKRRRRRRRMEEETPLRRERRATRDDDKKAEQEPEKDGNVHDSSKCSPDRHDLNAYRRNDQSHTHISTLLDDDGDDDAYDDESSESESAHPTLRAWAWKREHRPDVARFVRPYQYPLDTYTQHIYHHLTIYRRICTLTPRSRSSTPTRVTARPSPPPPPLSLRSSAPTSTVFAATRAVLRHLDQRHRSGLGFEASAVEDGFVLPTPALPPPPPPAATITIQQRRFQATGFASTVWDSSILTAKLIEWTPGAVVGQQVQYRSRSSDACERYLRTLIE